MRPQGVACFAGALSVPDRFGEWNAVIPVRREHPTGPQDRTGQGLLNRASPIAGDVVGSNQEVIRHEPRHEETMLANGQVDRVRGADD